jgi:hypothetical protein
MSQLKKDDKTRGLDDQRETYLCFLFLLPTIFLPGLAITMAVLTFLAIFVSPLPTLLGSLVRSIVPSIITLPHNMDGTLSQA